MVARMVVLAFALCACGGGGGGSKPKPPDIQGPEGDGGSVGTRASIVNGDAVFFVGNSFFASYDRRLPEWVSAIGEAVSPPVAIRTAMFNMPGSMHLSWFLQQQGVKDALASKAYKVYVIQGDEREPVDDPEGFKSAVREFKTKIEAANGKMMLFMTWNLEFDGDFYQKLDQTFDEISSELDLPVIPAGEIFHDCEQQDPFEGHDVNSAWLTQSEDNRHQNEVGSAVNAYATFSMLTGIDPEGVQFEAPAQTNSDALLKYLSDKTWARVEPRLP
ncbi:MAG TPA: hypothetical protein VFX59_30100 [Polyangiales bacterium]|nr:hypothetical protein [Polyangiales bacterium]